MQKIATRVFVYSSLLFSVLGIIIVITQPRGSNALTKLFMINVLIILTSFALSVAGKYLKDK